MAGWCSQYCTSMGGIRQTGIRCQNYKTKAEWQTGPISWSIPCGGETSTQARNGQLRLYKLASYNIELFWLTWYLVCTVILYFICYYSHHLLTGRKLLQAWGSIIVSEKSRGLCQVPKLDWPSWKSFVVRGLSSLLLIGMTPQLIVWVAYLHGYILVSWL